MEGAGVQQLFTTGTCHCLRPPCYQNKRRGGRVGIQFLKQSSASSLSCAERVAKDSWPWPMLSWHPRGVWQWLDKGCYHSPGHCNTTKRLQRRKPWFLLYILAAVDDFKVTEGSAMLWGLLKNASTLIQEKPGSRWMPGICRQAQRLLQCLSRAMCLGRRARLGCCVGTAWGCEEAVRELPVPHGAHSGWDGSCIGQDVGSGALQRAWPLGLLQKKAFLGRC